METSANTSGSVQLSDLHWMQVYDFFLQQAQVRMNEYIKDSQEINKCINECHAMISDLQSKKAQKEAEIQKQLNKKE